MNHGLGSVKGAVHNGSYFAVLTKQASRGSNTCLRQQRKCWNKGIASHCGGSLPFSWMNFV